MGKGRETGPERRPPTFAAFGTTVRADPIAPGLHVVATPIGHLGDVSIRALGVLAAADAILAEDTRVTRTLLARYGIGTPLVAYHEHSGPAARERAMARLAAGEALALVSDAGTPLVSDPGYRLVAAAIEAGIAVTAVPGPSAILAALAVAGLPTDRFSFEGFLPAKAGPRRARLAALAATPGTLVLYEAPHRLPASLADAADMLGPRPAAVARELTKLFEEVRRGPLDVLAAAYAAEGPPKGEIVVLIGPEGEAARAAEAESGADDRLRAVLGEGGGVKEAAARVAAETGLPRRDLYARALRLVAGEDEPSEGRGPPEDGA